MFKQIHRLLGVAMSAWILSYYLLPNTVFERYSIGYWLYNLANENRFKSNDLLPGFCAVLISIASISILRKMSDESTTDGSGRLPLWLLVTLYIAPEIYCLMTSKNKDLIGAECSLLITLGVGVICAYLCGSPRNIIFVFCLLGLMQSLFGIYYLHSGTNVLASGNVLRAGGTFDTPNGMYVLCMLGLSLAACESLIASDRSKWFWLLAFAGMFAGLMVTWYRGGMIAACLALSWLSIKVYRNIQVALIGLLLCIGLSWVVFQVRASGRIESDSLIQLVHGRFALWEQGYYVFERHWLTGVGAGALSVPLEIETPTPGILHPSIQIEPKNMLLYWLDERGIAGGILFLAFAYTLYGILSRCDSIEGLGLSASWFSLLISGIFDTPFGPGAKYYGNVLVALLLGATALLNRREVNEKN